MYTITMILKESVYCKKFNVTFDATTPMQAKFIGNGMIKMIHPNGKIMFYCVANKNVQLVSGLF